MELPHPEIKFTSERWGEEGVYDVIKSKKTGLMEIDASELLTIDQRTEQRMRELLFSYEIAYTEKAHELLLEEFKRIDADMEEERKKKASVDESAEQEFKKPPPPKKAKGRANVKKSAKSASSSETDEKDSDQEKPQTESAVSHERTTRSQSRLRKKS